MNIEKLRKLVKDNGLKLTLKGVHDASGRCYDIICIADGCVTNSCGTLFCANGACLKKCNRNYCSALSTTGS